MSAKQRQQRDNLLQSFSGPSPTPMEQSSSSSTILSGAAAAYVSSAAVDNDDDAAMALSFALLDPAISGTNAAAHTTPGFLPIPTPGSKNFTSSSMTLDSSSTSSAFPSLSAMTSTQGTHSSSGPSATPARIAKSTRRKTASSGKKKNAPAAQKNDTANETKRGSCQSILSTTCNHLSLDKQGKPCLGDEHNRLNSSARMDPIQTFLNTYTQDAQGRPIKVTALTPYRVYFTHPDVQNFPNVTINSLLAYLSALNQGIRWHRNTNNYQLTDLFSEAEPPISYFNPPLLGEIIPKLRRRFESLVDLSDDEHNIIKALKKLLNLYQPFIDAENRARATTTSSSGTNWSAPISVGASRHAFLPAPGTHLLAGQPQRQQPSAAAASASQPPTVPVPRQWSNH